MEDAQQIPSKRNQKNDTEAQPKQFFLQNTNKNTAKIMHIS